MNYVTWTYIARAIGIILLLPSLFYDQFLGIFPGLEDRRITMLLFVSGVCIFTGAAIVYFILRQRELARKSREQQDASADSRL